MHEHSHFVFILLKFTAGAILLVTLVVLFRMWLKHKERAWAFVLKQDNNKALAPLKITAYERLVVMLERISPESLVLRHKSYSASSGLLQLELIKSIREEFEHNVSLQMYVSMECWEKVKRAREETTELIKVAYTKVRPDSKAMDLIIEIMKLESVVGSSAIKDALLAIRVEMARYF